MIQRVFILFSMLCLSQSIFAQELFDDPKLYQGALILTDRSVLHCELKYHQSTETISVAKPIPAVYSAHDLLYFQFYDDALSVNRYFFSLKSEKDLRFFELLINGKIPIYRKSVIVENSYIDHYKNTTNIYLGNTIAHDLYFSKDGIMTRISDFEAELLPMMKSHIGDISQLIFTQKLDTELIAHQLLIIDHYNSLIEK